MKTLGAKGVGFVVSVPNIDQLGLIYGFDDSAASRKPRPVTDVTFAWHWLRCQDPHVLQNSGQHCIMTSVGQRLFRTFNPQDFQRNERIFRAMIVLLLKVKMYIVFDRELNPRVNATPESK